MNSVTRTLQELAISYIWKSILRNISEWLFQNFIGLLLSMSNVNADSDVEIIISGNKPSVLLNKVFIKKIQYRIILHL